MIENFTLDTDANPQNMNKLIEGINKNEEDISGLKTSVEGVSSQIGQIIDKEMYPVKVIDDLNLKIDGDRFSCKLPLPLNSPTTNAFYCDTVVWKDNSSFIEQTVREIAFGRIFRRVKNVSGWQPWIEISAETNTPIIKNVPAGVTKIKDVPMGIYRIYAGSTYFTDYPPMAKKMSHDYGILVVNYDGATYKTYSLIVSDASVTHNSEYTGFSGNGTEIKWSGVIPYSVNAAGGVTIISQNNYILNGVMYINLTVRKTDSSNFVAGVQYSIAGCPNLILTYPKNVLFTGWNLAGNVLIGSGGVGTIFVDTGLYIIPTAACGVLRITGEFLLE